MYLICHQVQDKAVAVLSEVNLHLMMEKVNSHSGVETYQTEVGGVRMANEFLAEKVFLGDSQNKVEQNPWGKYHWMLW